VQVTKAFVHILECGHQQWALLEMNDVMASRSIEPWTTIDNMEIHPIAVAKVRSNRDRIVHDRIRDSTEVLELAEHDVSLPLSLRISVRELPLAAAAHLCILTRRLPAEGGWLDDLDEGRSGPRAPILDDGDFDYLARHSSRNEMGLAVLACNGFPAVRDVMWVEFDHADNLVACRLIESQGPKPP
jgi:hypothetical protein